MADEEKSKGAKGAKEKTVKVKVLENGGIDEGGKFYAKGAVAEVTESRAEGLGDSVELVK